VDHPGWQRESEPVVGGQELFAAVPEPGALIFVDHVAGLDRLADADQRPIDRQRHRRRIHLVQLTEQPTEIGGTGRGAFLRQILAQRNRVAAADDGLVD
jgi:hypothetical protein